MLERADKVKSKYTSWFLQLLPILVSAIVVLIIYYPVFFMGYWAVNSSDALYLHLPNNHLVASVFREGQFPLWNPNFNLGQPIIDGTTQIFHPAMILYLVFSHWLAHTLEILMGIFLAFLGMWFLLRQQGFDVFPTIIGMLIYVLCGPVFFLHTYHLGFMAILILPWCIWSFHQFDNTNHARWLWLAAVLCILAVHSLDIDTLAYLYIGLIIDRLTCFPKSRRAFYLITCITIFFLSALSGLLWYLPLYEWLAHSSRLLHSYVGILTPNLLNMLVAMFTNNWLEKCDYDVFYFYFGPAIIWLILAGLIKPKRMVYIFRYFLYSLCIPIFYIIARLLQLWYSGVWGSVDAWRSMYVFCLGLAMIGAFGIQQILRGGHVYRWLALLSGSATIILAIWTIGQGMNITTYIGLLIIGCSILFTLIPYSKKFNLLQSFGIAIAIIASSLVPAIARLTSLPLCEWGSTVSNLKIQPPWLQCSTFMRDLPFYYKLSTEPDGKVGHWRISTISILDRTDNITSLAGLKTAPNYTTIYNKAMENAFCSDGLILRRSIHPYWMTFNSIDARTLSLYGIRFLIGISGILSSGYEVGDWIERVDLSWPEHRVLENKYYIGRAYLITSSGGRRSGAIFIQDDPANVVLQVESEDSDRLVLADLNYPGWQAFVDDKPVPIESYHGCLRSIRLSKGIHMVRWNFTGRTQRLGLVLSMSTVLFLTFFLSVLSILNKKCVVMAS